MSCGINYALPQCHLAQEKNGWTWPKEANVLPNTYRFGLYHHQDRDTDLKRPVGVPSHVDTATNQIRLYCETVYCNDAAGYS